MWFEVDEQGLSEVPAGEVPWNALNVHSLDAWKGRLPAHWLLPIVTGLAASVGSRYFMFY